MRVITGQARGRLLKPSPGREVRPTESRVKEGLFNALQFQVAGRRALDLFAGTGQLGIEALSRGAAACVFVERNRETAALVRENLRSTGLADRGEVICADAFRYLASARELPTGNQFDLVFLDPPYADGVWEKALEGIAPLLAPGGLVACEFPQGTALPDRTGGLAAGKTYHYSRVNVTLYHQEEEACL